MYGMSPVPKTVPFDAPDRTLHSASSDPQRLREYVKADEEQEPPSSEAEKLAQTHPSHLPPAFLERGQVTSKNEMTTHYTDREWERIIADFEKGVIRVDESKTYPLPHGKEGLNKTIDHTLLKLDAVKSQFDVLCAEAKEYDFAAVCVRPDWVKHCVALLQGTSIRVASVIGFHEGTYPLSTKLSETRASLEAGALELDVVINYPSLNAKSYSEIYNELFAIRNAAPRPVLLKLILETSQLDKHQIVAGCVLAGAAEFDFVKTSTGFNGAGASVENVRLMKACCEKDGKGMRVKASGGVRTYADAVRMLEAGASRLGASAGVSIAQEARGQGVNGEASKSDY